MKSLVVIKKLRTLVDFLLTSTLNFFAHIQNDQKVSVHLMITVQKFTGNVQSVPRQSPDIC